MSPPPAEVARLLTAALLAFAVGSLPIGLLVGRAAAGIDIREYGTGNIGASNTFRNVGLLPAAVVGVASFAQGLLPAWLAGRTWGVAALATAAVGAVAGYAWSPLLHGRGGSAVGTATGALAAIDVRGLLVVLALYAVGGLLRRPAPAVLAGLVAFAAFTIAAGDPVPLRLAAGTILLVVVLKRLDGALADIRAGHGVRSVRERLIFDRKPGRPLVGRFGAGPAEVPLDRRGRRR